MKFLIKTPTGMVSVDRDTINKSSYFQKLIDDNYDEVYLPTMSKEQMENFILFLSSKTIHDVKYLSDIIYLVEYFILGEEYTEALDDYIISNLISLTEPVVRSLHTYNKQDLLFRILIAIIQYDRREPYQNNPISIDEKVLNLLISSIRNINQTCCTYSYVALFQREIYQNVGNTALIEACIYKKTQIVKLLIEHGADVNIYNNRENTALIQYCRHITLHTDIPKLLVNAGVDLTYRDELGRNALMLACQFPNNTDTVKYLSGAGCAINMQDCYGRTALMDCVSCGFLENVKVLLELGACTYIRNNFDRTVFDMVSDAEILNLLEDDY